MIAFILGAWLGISIGFVLGALWRHHRGRVFKPALYGPSDALEPVE